MRLSMSNLINIKDFKNKVKESQDSEVTKSEGLSEEEFKVIMDKNKKNSERVASERARANNNVKRAYQLKPNDPNNKR